MYFLACHPYITNFSFLPVLFGIFSVFKALLHKASVKGGAHKRSADAQIPDAYAAHMCPSLSVSSVLQLGNAIHTQSEIMFNFYLGQPQMRVSGPLYDLHACHMLFFTHLIMREPPIIYSPLGSVSHCSPTRFSVIEFITINFNTHISDIKQMELNFQWLLSCLLHREKGYLLLT